MQPAVTPLGTQHKDEMQGCDSSPTAQPPMATTQLPGSPPSHPWVPSTERSRKGVTAALQRSLQAVCTTQSAWQPML